MTADFHALPIPTLGCLNLLRRQGVNQQTLCDIIVKLSPVELLPNRRFEFCTDDDAEPAFVIEAMDACGEPTDLVAWPIYEPDRWAVLEWRAWCLGEPALINPATYFSGGALRAVRTPLAWLQAGGEALCILDPVQAWWRLRGCESVTAENFQHGEELELLLLPPAPITKIVLPRDVVEAAE